MIYIQYIRVSLIGFLLSILVFVLAVYYQLGSPTESSRWIYEIYQIKTTIAQSIKSPKLVIVAGSNALFGISCQMLHQATEVACVNGGTHAGLGLDYLLNQAPAWLKRGDTVLFPLEYELYQYSGVPNYTLIDYVFSRDPNYLLSADLIQKIRLIFGASFARIQQGYISKISSPVPLTTGYQSKSINQYGDETVNLKKNMTEIEYDTVSKSQASDLLKSHPQINSHARKKISSFINWCQNNNIKFIATWPNTVNFDIYQGLNQQIFFKEIEDFYVEIGIPVLGKPQDFMYDKSMFFDTIYHLNDKGVRYRTQQLIPLLRPYLPQQSVVEIQSKR